MISVLPIEDKEKIKKLFDENNLEFNGDSNGVEAKDKDEVLGYCLFYLDTKRITVLCVKPENDLPLADGILRSALHVAAERSIMDARYTDDFEPLFEKLSFIKNKSEKTLNIDKLFGGCGCKGKNF